ncbi:MAG: HAMP domain-containing protein, partial [Myxococcales bacterium]|nr:HAMP domain-containing protein [Myxococcales bacterium]
MRLSIPGRVFAAFVALLITFGAVSGYTLWQVRALGDQVRRLHASLIPTPAIVGEIEGELAGLDRVLEQEDGPALRRGVHLARRAHPYLTRLDDGFDRALARLAAPKAAPQAEPFVARLSGLQADREALRVSVQTFFDAVEADESAETLAEARRAARRPLRRVGRAVSLIRVDLAQSLDRAILALSAEEERAGWGAIVLAAVAMIIGVVITLSTSRLVRPLRTLRAGVERLAQGEYDPPVVVDMPGELGALAADFNRMAEA